MNRVLFVASLAVASLLAACASAPKQAAPVAAPAPAAVAAINITGAWSLSVETPMGARDMKLDAIQKGETFTGSIANPQGNMPITGTVKGKDVAFMMKVNAQGMDLQIDYKGVVEGDTMKGTAKFGEFGDGTFTGKKQ